MVQQEEEQLVHPFPIQQFFFNPGPPQLVLRYCPGKHVEASYWTRFQGLVLRVLVVNRALEVSSLQQSKLINLR